LPFYNIVNGGYDLHHFISRDVPIFFAVNGKYDELLGWTECVSYYDSVNHNLSGGFYLWDLRDHSGDNKTWNSTNFNFLRYAKNQSYPALSNCSVNGNPGNGTGTSGDTAGTINGFVDWDNNNITDNGGSWTINMFLRSLLTWNNISVPSPDSCTANITPRRLQHFKIPLNAAVKWRVKHKGSYIQQGSFIYKGGLITIPGVKIYKDTVSLQLTYSGGSKSGDRTSTEMNSNALISPNPNHGQFTISFNNPDLPANIEVRNLIGDLIMTKEVGAGENQSSVQLPGTIPSGMYIVRVMIGNHATVQKIMVQ
jgi:Secretion system C-terminal sorting domain